ncbi:MAG: transporter substrate-binding domain-containing protein [Myxococcota bacterium]|nr:transporter substrate-binding domain-containing protein [Myxococcota bacterium]
MHSSRLLWALTFTLVLSGGCKCAGAPSPGADGAARSASADESEPEIVAVADVAAAQGDLEAMRERGTLRVLVATHEETSLPRSGIPSREERKVAEAFAAELGLRPVFVVTGSWDALLPALIEGKGDVIASNLTVTPSRAAQVAFSRPLAVVAEVVIGRRGAQGLPKNAEGLAGREVHVRKSSAFAETLQELSKQVEGLKVVFAPESLDTESLAYQVGRGERPLTVVDSHLSAAMAAYNPDVQALFPIAEGRKIAWATRKADAQLNAALNAFMIEKSLTGHSAERFVGDLAEIKQRGVLRVLTRNNPVTYYLHQGQQQGFDFQLVALAAKELGVRLEMVVPPSRDLLLPWLLEGRGDVIAASFTVTPERREKAAFSEPYFYIDEVLVQRKGAGITSLDGLRGKRIHLRRSSSHWQSLEALQPDHGPFELVAEAEDVETEELIAAVGKGDLPFTVADSNLLDLELKYRDDVEAGPRLLPRGAAADAEGTSAIAYALRPQNTALKGFFDGFVKKTYRGLEYNMARRRYFENTAQRSRADDRAGVTGEISPYDPLLKKYSRKYRLDWRLMAAQAYQESRFDPKARSWVGARGLFQVMPATGKEMGFINLEDPEVGVHAGVQYMSRLINKFEPTLPFKQRVRFALAAYNVGYGHVQDARRLAAKLKLDPDRWFGNVERAMLLLEKPQYNRRARHGYCRGSEPVKYVSEIQNRYDNYVKVLATATASDP